MPSVSETFGSCVFDDRVMKARLSGDIYHSMKQTIKKGMALDSSVANAVASAMRDWAVENGATHFTHWFQPMTGITAEKHESFISPSPDGGVIMDFSGKELIKGESDASSFPSGGLRATFEARGYTTWDPTSYAFIKDKTLCIPTAFCTYSGDALDKKTPLLRSMEALNKQTLRILKLFGHDEVSRVIPLVGAEQEYFLIDRKLYEKRPDLINTGRTLFGAKPAKSQEMDDHYFGAISPRVLKFMEELDNELWKLGILAKTEHNEVAPAQHELAPIFTTVNIATDHNQLTMEIMQKVAQKHGMVCLLAEKPFGFVNGSGKHNNWSLSTNTGVNLLSPGDTPYENAQFLLVLVAMIKAVDDYQDLLRTSVATAGNDRRLGGAEAPPVIVSMFLGDELTDILDSIEKEVPYNGIEKTVMKLGVHTLPRFIRDTTDRNRTSPFAFTGNKFEFRMPGSSDSIACVNIMLNSAVADTFRVFADYLEKAEDFNASLHELIKKTYSEHKKIIFNGNGYDDAWAKEAVEKRGLLNLKSTPDCLPSLLYKKNIDMLTGLKVFSVAELRSRHDILMENYCKTILIESNTMIHMVKRDILPAVSSFTHEIASTVKAKKVANSRISCIYETRLLEKLSDMLDKILEETECLEKTVRELPPDDDRPGQAISIRDKVIPKMAKIRTLCDEAETVCDRNYWPYPTYSEMLFSTC